MKQCLKTQTHFVLEDNKWPTGLKTAEQISVEIGIKPERLMELALGHYVPHWVIDGSQPMFQTGELKQWIRKNLMEYVDGNELPIQLKVSVLPPPAIEAPLSIREIEGLREVPIFRLPTGIYFLVKNNEVVYVGQSIEPLVRINQHRDKDFDRVYLLPIPQSALDAVEGSLIRALRPILNGCNINGTMIAPRDSYIKDEDVLEKYCKKLNHKEKETK